MIPIIIAASRGIAGGLSKKVVKKIAKKQVNNIKKTQDTKGSDLRPDKRLQEASENEQFKILQKEASEKEKKDNKISKESDSNQKKQSDKISKIESEIEELKKELKDGSDNKIDPSVLKIEKDKLGVLKDQLSIQKEQLEETKEAEYDREHDRKITLKDRAKSLAIKAKDGVKSGMGKVASGVKNNKGLLGKILGVGAMIAMFWPQIKEKLGAFVEWIAENIPPILSTIWDKITDMASGLMDMVVKYGPGLLQNLINGLGTIASSLLDGIVQYGPTVLTMLIDGIKTLAEKILAGIVEYGPSVMSMLWEGFKGLLKAIIPLLIEYVPIIAKLIWNGLNVMFNDIVDGIKEYGPVLWEKLKNGISIAAEWLTTKAGELGTYLWTGIKEKFSELKDWVFGAISDMWDGIQDFIYDKTGGLFGTEKLSEKEKIKVSSNIETTKFSSRSNDFRDQLAELGIIDKELTTKDEIESEAKLKLLPNEQLIKLMNVDWLDEKGKKSVEKVFKENNKPRKVPVEKIIESKKQRKETSLNGIKNQRDMLSKNKKHLENLKSSTDDDGKKEQFDKGINNFEKLIKKLDAKEKALNAPIKKMVANQTEYSIADGKGGQVSITKEQNELLKKIEEKLSKSFSSDDGNFDNLLKERKAARDKILADNSSGSGSFMGVTNSNSSGSSSSNTSSSSPSIVKNNGTTFTPEPVKVKASVQSADSSEASNDTDIKSVKDIKVSDVIKLNGSARSGFNNMNPDFKHNITAMGYEYKEKFGKKLNINSAYRSVSHQTRLYNEMLRKNGGKSNGSVATPGGSMHNYGLAIDANTTELNKADKAGLMAKYNLHRPIHMRNGKWESWHVEPTTLNNKDKNKIRANGRRYAKEGKDMDSIVKSGSLTEGKVTKVDANGTSLNIKEGPVSNNEMASTFKTPNNEVSNEEINITDKVKAAAVNIDKSSIKGVQGVLSTFGITDKNGDINLGDSVTPSGNQTSMSSVIKNTKGIKSKNSIGDMVNKKTDGIKGTIDTIDKSSLKVIQGALSKFGITDKNGDINLGDSVTPSGNQTSINSMIKNNGFDGKNIFSDSKNIFSDSVDKTKNMFKEGKNGLMAFLNKSSDTDLPSSKAEVKKFDKTGNSLNVPKEIEAIVSKTKQKEIDIGSINKKLSEKTAPKPVKEPKPAENKTIIQQIPAPSIPTTIGLDDADFNDNTLSLVGGII